jgi:hypothetical protein
MNMNRTFDMKKLAGVLIGAYWESGGRVRVVFSVDTQASIWTIDLRYMTKFYRFYRLDDKILSHSASC